MDITTMEKDAEFCVASVRPRVAGVLIGGRLAAAQLSLPGIALSCATAVGGQVVSSAPVRGDVSVATRSFATYNTPDVVRSRSGRPPV